MIRTRKSSASSITCIAFLVAAWVLPLGAAAGENFQTIGLTTSETLSKSGWAPVLARELARQALLISARDQLGLFTRDEALREPLEGPGMGPIVDLKIEGETPVHVTIKLHDGGGVVWEGDLQARLWHEDLFGICVDAERLSRTELVDGLVGKGFAGKPVAVNPKIEVPPTVETALAEMTELSQLAAVRQIHRLILDGGETPALRGALVRGYANLGQLTSFHWNASHKVYLARSLLYAQRMVVSHPQSRIALWHRAYALALSGLQGAALQDMAAAEKLAPEAGSPPAWVALIDPYCKYDVRALLDVKDKHAIPLATFLAFLTVEHSGSQGAVMNLARAAWSVSPGCLRLVDAMCEQTGPGMLNRLTEIGPDIFSQSLGNKLPKFPGFPKDVLDQIGRLKQEGAADRRVVLTHALLGAAANGSDPNEPSCAVLGRMIEEISFVHVQRRCDLITMQWGSDASGYVQQVRPLVADHPFKALIESYGSWKEGGEHPTARALLSKLTFSEVGLEALPASHVADYVGLIGAFNGVSSWNRLTAHCDAISNDLETMIPLYHNKTDGFRSVQTSRLEACSPHSPVAVATKLSDRWAEFEQQVPKIDAEYGDHPAVARVLMKKYIELKRWSDAERCAKAYIEIAQDLEGYLALAKVYENQGDMKKRRETLEAYLQQEDYGLQHAQVQAMIAEQLMKDRDFTGAQPYAEAAAHSGAAWTMLCAARCAEGLGQWDRAEAWVRETVDHYGETEIWYLWCRSTGHGDAEAARRAALSRASDLVKSQNLNRLASAALIYLGDGDGNSAQAQLKRMWSANGDPWAALQSVWIAQAAGDVATRDAALSAAIENGPTAVSTGRPKQPHLVALAALLRDAWARKTPLDGPAVDKLVNEFAADDESKRLDVHFFAAQFFSQNGQSELAADYFNRCAGTPLSPSSSAGLARIVLREGQLIGKKAVK